MIIHNNNIYIIILINSDLKRSLQSRKAFWGSSIFVFFIFLLIKHLNQTCRKVPKLVKKKKYTGGVRDWVAIWLIIMTLDIIKSVPATKTCQNVHHLAALLSLSPPLCQHSNDCNQQILLLSLHWESYSLQRLSLNGCFLGRNTIRPPPMCIFNFLFIWTHTLDSLDRV